MCHFFEHALRKFVAYPRRSYYTVFRVKVLWQVRLESLESGEGKLVVEEKSRFRGEGLRSNLLVCVLFHRILAGREVIFT